MTNEEVLKAARNEINKNGEYEKTIERNSMRYAAVVGLLLMVVLMIFEWIVLKKCDFGKPAIFFMISSYGYLYEGFKLHNNKKIYNGIAELLITFIFIFLYLLEL